MAYHSYLIEVLLQFNSMEIFPNGWYEEWIHLKFCHAFCPHQITMKTSLWLNLYNIPAMFRATPPKLVLIWPGLVPSAYVTKMIRQLQGRKSLYIVLTIIFCPVILATKSMMAPPITTYSNTLWFKKSSTFCGAKDKMNALLECFNAICWMFYKDILCTLVLQVLSD